MDNFGFKEPGIVSKPSRRSRFKRTISVYSGMVPENSVEEVPLDNTKQKNCKATSLRWKPDPESALDSEQPSSDDFEYMVVGPSPPAESAPNMYDSYEEPSTELSVQVCSDTIKQALIEQSRQASVRSTLFEDIISTSFTPEVVLKTLENSSKVEKNICLLWSAFNKRWDLLEPLLCIGADIHFCDTGGLSALHMSSFIGCINSANFLILKGADVNMMTKCFTPLHCSAFGNQPEIAKLLINNGAIVSLTTKRTNCEETILHCAVRTNAVECLQIFIAAGVDVNDIEPSGMNSIHLAADLGMVRCLEILLKCKDADVNARTKIKDKESTALHLAADEGNIECVDLLLNHGADAKLKNHRGFTALHLAARCSNLECVESLLKKGKANPNAEDYDKRTPLHAAIGKAEAAFDIIETLISWGANVNQKDEYGFTPLHLAALDGLSNCVETLIYHGADVTTKSKKGNSALNVITRKTPASKAMIIQKLDDAITLHRLHDPANREVEMELDFRNILQHHPREISYLNTFVDEGQKEILSHPLCSAFLHIKWEKIRKYYIARLIFCLVFVIFLTLYALTKLKSDCLLANQNFVYCGNSNCTDRFSYCTNNVTDNDNSDDTINTNVNGNCSCGAFIQTLYRFNFTLQIQWYILFAITLLEVFRKLYGIVGYSTMRQYLSQLENVLEWFVTVCVILISCVVFEGSSDWQSNLSAFAVLAGWTNLMLMVGQLPVFGSYVAMYQTVLKEFVKLVMAYSCILIGFTMSFCIVFPDLDVYMNPLVGFISVFVMMVGELDSSLLTGGHSTGALITFVLFLMFVTVTLMNLLVGIAVHDIQGLRKTAGLSKLVRQTKLISYMESALFNPYLPKFLLKGLLWSALVSPQAYRVVLSVKPLNPSEKRLPRDIMKAAYEIARLRKNHGRTVSPKISVTNSFKRFDNNNTEYNGEFSYDTGLLSLQTKIDEANDKIELLSIEIKELTNLVKILVSNNKKQNM